MRFNNIQLPLTTYFKYVLVCFLSLPSASAVSDDLLQIVELAQLKDSVFLAAERKYNADREIYTQAGSRLMPTLAYEYQKKETNQEIIEADNSVFAEGKESFKTTNDGFTLTQPLFDWQIWSKYRQSKSSVSRADADFKQAQNDLLLRVAEAYFLVLEMSDQLLTASDEKQALQQHAKLAEKRKQAGLGRTVDVDTAQARYLEAVAKEIEYESRLIDSRYGLAELIGNLPGSLQRLSEDMIYQPVEPKNPQEWVDLAKISNPKIIAREHALEEAQQEVNARRSGHYPTVLMTLTDGGEDAEGSLFGGASDVETSEVVVSVKVPIFQGFYHSSRVRQAHEDRYRVLDELHLAQRQSERAVRDAFQRIDASVVQIDALKRSVEAQQRMLKIKTIGYKAGRFSLLEVLDAQKDVSNVKRAYTKSRYDYVLNTLRLKQASGVINVDDLARINSWLI